MIKNPLHQFNYWFEEAKRQCQSQQKGAVCLSTIDQQGYPDSRFVDLKEVTEVGFTFCSDYQSNKGISIDQNPRVGLTVWWESIKKQIRVKGIAEKVSADLSDKYWETRSRSAQLTTWASQQSHLLKELQQLTKNFERFHENFANKLIPRPNSWGGFLIKPTYFEFLTFKENRMHIRQVFVLEDTHWTMFYLQP